MSLIDITTGKEVWIHRDINGGRVAISPDGKYVASGCGKVLKLFYLKTGEEIRSFDSSESTNSIAFSPEGTHILAGYNNIIKMWEVETRQTS